MITWARIDRGVPGSADAHDIANAVATKVNRYETSQQIPEYDHLGQFLIAVKHPIVGRAVWNAAINRWGLSEHLGLPALF
jgi:hypothetical protein